MTLSFNFSVSLSTHSCEWISRKNASHHTSRATFTRIHGIECDGFARQTTRTTSRNLRHHIHKQSCCVICFFFFNLRFSLPILSSPPLSTVQAHEMTERLSKVYRAGTDDSKRVFIGTFHKLCLQLLRQNARAVGMLPAKYRICSEFECKKRLFEMIEQEHLEEQTSVEEVLNVVAVAKNRFQTAEELLATCSAGEKLNAQLYKLYEDWVSLCVFFPL